MEIEIYTIKNCKDCEKVKQYLDSKKIAYILYDMKIGGIPELQQMKKKFKEMGLKTYPVTLIKDEGGIIPLEGFDKKEFDRMFNNEYDLGEFEDVEDIYNIPYKLKKQE